MVDADLLATKLASLGNHLRRIEEERTESADAFLADQRAQELVAFNVLLAIQDAIDVAAHVVADAGWGVPATAREHFDLLVRHGVIDATLASELAACAGLRNLVAHRYGDLDLARLHAEVPAGLDALRRFAALLATRGG